MKYYLVTLVEKFRYETWGFSDSDEGCMHLNRIGELRWSPFSDKQLDGIL